MSYTPTYKKFIFEDYYYDSDNGVASFDYSFDKQLKFTERIMFDPMRDYNAAVLDRALWLSFLLAGISYYKSFPGAKVDFGRRQLTPLDAELLNAVYRDGLSQFVFENNLSPEILPQFSPSQPEESTAEYTGSGLLAMQSGGKDSLLLAELLKRASHDFETVYMTSGSSYPDVIGDIQKRPPRLIRRQLDRDALAKGKEAGALNGHVPITYITYSFALIDAILHGEDTVLAAIGREGAEAHEYIGDFAINHQWSKTWEAEQLLARYVGGRIGKSLKIGSPLRGFAELRIAELFVYYDWEKYHDKFSSCNVINYAQGQQNRQLRWCGQCPKCANSFLLFAPFVEPDELEALFGGQNLFAATSLTEMFKGLLGIDGVMKPFECVGEIDELRLAYHMARQRYGYDRHLLPFEVPASNFDYLAIGASQSWASDLISDIE